MKIIIIKAKYKLILCLNLRNLALGSLKSKILHKGFVTNKIIHEDLNLPYVADLDRSRYLPFLTHPNQLI